jgi:hypothetical protein
MVVLIVCLVFGTSAPALAGFGLYNFGGRIGKDVVQGDDTRTLYVMNADIATVFSPRVLWELSAERGSGDDLAGNEVIVTGGSTLFKYYWVNQNKTAYAFTGGGIGLNRYRRFEAGAFRTQWNSSLHWVLLGMEKHLTRVKGVFEVKWLLGNIEGASALRVDFGLSYKIRMP